MRKNRKQQLGLSFSLGSVHGDYCANIEEVGVSLVMASDSSYDKKNSFIYRTVQYVVIHRVELLN